MFFQKFEKINQKVPAVPHGRIPPRARTPTRMGPGAASPREHYLRKFPQELIKYRKALQALDTSWAGEFASYQARFSTHLMTL